MKFFTTLLALPLLGAVLASPVPAKEEKRLLGLDLGLGGVSETLDLQGLLDGLTKDLVCALCLLPLPPPAFITKPSNSCSQYSNHLSMLFWSTLALTTSLLFKESLIPSRVSWRVSTRSSKMSRLGTCRALLMKCMYNPLEATKSRSADSPSRSAQVEGVLTTVQETIDGLPTVLLDVPTIVRLSMLSGSPSHR